MYKVFWGMTIQAAISAIFEYNSIVSLTWQNQRNAACIFLIFTVFALIIQLDNEAEWLD